MAMTNAQIIFMEACKLMDAGKIGTTGRGLKVTDANGNEKIVMEPEAIHTFAAWKELGYKVKKGEHAIARFMIWKHATKVVTDDDGNEVEKGRMFLKEACFFGPAQVEPIKAAG